MTTVVGSFDKYVGIEYSIEQSNAKERDLWFTTDSFTYYLGNPAEERFVTVPKGFFTDGASVPRMFWWLFPPWGIYGQAAIVHDYLCETGRLTKNGTDSYTTLNLEQIDRVFYDAMKVAGTPGWKRTIIYGAVKLFHNLGFF